MGILNDSKWQSNGNRMGIIYGGLIPHKNIWIEMVAFVWGFDGQNSGFLGNEPEKKIPWNHEVSCKHPSIQCWDIVTATMDGWCHKYLNIIHLYPPLGFPRPKMFTTCIKKKKNTHCLTILRMIGANWHSRLWHAWPLMLHCTQVVSPNRKWKMYRYFFRVHGHYEPTSRYTFKHCLFFL